MTETDQRLLVTCELALVGVTAAIIVGFGRLFVDWSFLPELAVLGAASHLLALVMRRTGRGIVVSAFASLVGLVIVGGLVLYADTTFFGLPTGDTRSALRTDIAQAWDLFGVVRAPAEVHPGFVAAAGIAVWLVAFLSDWAAFRLWSPIEACAPAAIVFLFCSLQRAEHYQAVSTALFAAAVLVFVLMHRLVRHDTGSSWLATEPAKGRTAIVRVGSIVGAAAIVTGLVVGPALPGASEEAVVPWRDIGESGDDDSRVTVSPLVTIRDRLVNQSSVEAFAVQTTRPDYWRLTALDRFDGVAWTSSGRYEDANGSLPTKLPSGTTTTTVRQQFTILGLDSLWLPAAYEPEIVIEDGGLDPTYEAESGTLTVGDGMQTADGATYLIESRVPNRDPAAIAAAREDVPDGIVSRYTALPDDFSGAVVAEAQRITADSPTPYAKAIALQNYFRDNFTYSLDVDNGHGNDAIEQFLTNRIGYCEQFAGTFAAMARAVGLPARVAVGFTPGEPDEEGIYRVMGRNAHAWPEVYLSGVGWLRFEPTPGRGAPDDQSYTGVTPGQAQEDGTAGPAPAPGTTAVPGVPDVLPVDPGLDGVIPPFDPELGTTSGVVSEDSSRGSPSDLVPLLGVLLGVAAIVVGSIPLAKRIRRTRRLSQLRSSARGHIDAAWESAMHSLGLLDIPIDRAATPHELAMRASPLVGNDTAPALAELAQRTTEARFGPDEPDRAARDEADGIAHRIRHSVVQRVSWKRRLRRAFDPRPLLPGNELT